MWGFTQQTIAETVTPINHQPQINPQNDRNQNYPTHYQQTQTTPNPLANRDNPVQHSSHQPGTNQPINQQPSHTDQDDPMIAHQGPVGITNNPIKLDQLQDTYLLPWGNQLQQPKPANTIHICLQNFGGWPTLAKHQKNDNIQCFVNSTEIDVLLKTENNVTWHKLLDKNRIQEWMQGWWESLHVTTVHNTTDQNARAYQPGGVG